MLQPLQVLLRRRLPPCRWCCCWCCCCQTLGASAGGQMDVQACAEQAGAVQAGAVQAPLQSMHVSTARA